MTMAEERQAFSRRLREAMRRARVDPSSPTRVAREFNLRYDGDPVSTQSVRKWLTGRALPEQDKVRALALWLNVPVQWLRFGESERKDEAGALPARQDTAGYRIEPAWPAKKFELLNEAHKRVVLEIIHALLRLEGKR
jgi:transcriptional regulator with XRE-family HTH domain